MSSKKIFKTERLTLKEKNANDYAWFKTKIDQLDSQHNSLYSSGVNSEPAEYKRMQVNYDLFNNKLNLADFNYVCKPYGADSGELPAEMVNRDISSGKIKAVLGMEMKRPFSYRALATNSEATTRIEEEEFNKIKQFVINDIMLPIRQQTELKYQEQLQNQELTSQQKTEIQQQIAQETQSLTPDRVRQYMEREHQDPVEVMTHQLLEYLWRKCNLKKKFNKAFKHLNLSAKEVLYVGTFNGHPEVWNVNSQRFNFDMSPDLDFIEDGEFATCEYRMSPSQVMTYFGEELSKKDIDDIFSNDIKRTESRLRDSIFTFDTFEDYDSVNTVRVLHAVWRGLRKFKFLTYKDEEGEEHKKIVDENYKLNKEAGDIKIKIAWLPEVYETWKINDDKYVRMRPLPGQFKDLNDIHHCKLPYYGAVCDNLNSQPTCLMDRLKVYQYYYNIIMYRIELLLASDKGKKILMNINAIPDSDEMDIKKWKYFFESSPFAWYDPDQEGVSGDATSLAKVLDMSLVSDIGKYIDLALFIKQAAGESVGITAGVEGQTSPYESVGNNRTNLAASSNILEPFFDLHAHVKKNVIQALIEQAKVAYHGKGVIKLSYVLDDMSRKILTLDTGLLNNSTIGIYIDNSAKASEIKDMIQQFAHAALQNQKVELSDIISVVRQEGIAEAEETLKVAEKERREFEAQQQQKQLEAQEKAQKAQAEENALEHERKLEIIKLQEEERRKTEVIKGALVGYSFNPDQDKDQDGVNDFLEVAKAGLNAEVQMSKQQIEEEKQRLEREKFEHQKVVDGRKLDNEEEKVVVEKNKLAAAAAKNTKNHINKIK